MKMYCADDIIQMSVISIHRELFGNKVEVVKGRKVPIGTKGKVVRLYSNRYTTWSYSVRIGIETEDGDVVYTDARNVKVIKEN